MDSVTFQVGRDGEDNVIEYLQRRGCAVIDLRDIPEYRDQDIDLSILPPNGVWRDVEIKTDTIMHKTGNMMVELSMRRKTGTYDGWFYKCRADILCYVDEYGGILYFINWPRLHDYVEELIAQDPASICEFKNPYDADCEGRGVLINVKKVLVPHGLVLKIAQSETIKRAAACREAGIKYKKEGDSATLLLPA